VDSAGVRDHKRNRSAKSEEAKRERREDKGAGKKAEKSATPRKEKMRSCRSPAFSPGRDEGSSGRRSLGKQIIFGEPSSDLTSPDISGESSFDRIFV
jgi:hypothetical protein